MNCLLGAKFCPEWSFNPVNLCTKEQTLRTVSVTLAPERLRCWIPHRVKRDCFPRPMWTFPAVALYPISFTHSTFVWTQLRLCTFINDSSNSAVYFIFWIKMFVWRYMEINIYLSSIWLWMTLCGSYQNKHEQGTFESTLTAYRGTKCFSSWFLWCW